MDNKTQVNINRNNRNRIPPWAWGAIAAATLALILGYLLFFNRPAPQSAVTPTPTATTAVMEVTSTPNLLTPSATPLSVEVTPTPGTPSPAPPTATTVVATVVVEVTSTPAPATATRPVVATVTRAATASATTATGSTPAATTGASPSPQATMTSDEQAVMTALQSAPNGNRVSSVRFDGTNLRVGYQIVEGGTAESPREQVRALLVALAGSTLNYSKLMLMGSQTSDQGTPAIQLTYDRNTVSTTDWTAAPAADIYGKAETQTIQPPYNTP